MRKVLLLVLLLLGFSSIADAQWRLVFRSDPWNSDLRHYSAYFPGMVSPFAQTQVSAIYFLSREGQQNVGFIATYTYDAPLYRDVAHIWRTSDAGSTWTEVFHDTSSYWVHNFSFENASVGYASGWSLYGTTLLKTTDGGITWNSVTAPGYTNAWSYVYYNIPKSRLLYCSYDSLFHSTDHAASWKYDASIYIWGLAFANDSLGIASDWHGAFMGRKTTDGGAHWSNLTTSFPFRQPDALSPSNFFIANDNGVTAARSTNAGGTWTNMSVPSIDNLTGNVAGDARRLYLVGRKGTASSTDTGVTWNKICGPTSYSVTPHFAHGDTVYMTDFLYGVWMNPTGQDSDIRYPLLGGGFYRGSTCKPVTTSFGFYNGNSCSQVQITSFAFWGSNRFKLLSDTSRHHQIMGIGDSLTFWYDPYGVGRDTFFVRVTYAVGGDFHIDTFYMIGIRARPFSFVPASNATDTLLVNVCDSSIATLSITNTCCDTLHLRNVHLRFGNFFQIEPFVDSVLPTQMVTVRVRGDGPRPGVYRDTLYYTVVRDTNSQSGVVPIFYRIPDVGFSIDSLHLTRRLTCVPLDTTLYFTNVFCDSLEVLGLRVNGSLAFTSADSVLGVKIGKGSRYGFHVTVRTDSLGTFTALGIARLRMNGYEWDTTLVWTLKTSSNGAARLTFKDGTFADSCSLADIPLRVSNITCDTMYVLDVVCNGPVRLDTVLTYPVRVTPDSVLTLRFAPSSYAKGSYSGVVVLRLTSHGNRFDTVLTLRYVVQSNVRAKIATASTRCQFPTSTLCGSIDTLIRFANASCRSTVWTQANWVGGIPDYTFDDPGLPHTIIGGGVDSIRVHFSPTATGQRGTQLHLKLQTDAQTLDTTFVFSCQVSGSGIFAPATANIDTMQRCGAVERETWIVNVACDSVKLTDIHASDGSIAITAPPVGSWVHSKDTVIIRFLVSATSDGDYSSRISVTDSSANGVETIPIEVSGWVTAPHRALAILPSTLDLSDAPACVDFDTAITIVNRSDCDTLAIGSAQLLTADPHVSIVSPTVGAVLHPHDSLRVVLRYHLDPLQTLRDTCRITGDTTIDIPLTVVAGGAQSALSMASDASFNARICTSVTKWITFRDVGCADITVDSIVLQQPATTQSSFRVVPARSLPYVVTSGKTDSLECTFDAQASGQVRAVIYIHSTASNAVDSVVLTGIGYGERSTLSLTSLINGGRVAVALPNDVVTYSVRLADDLPADEGLDRISFDVQYNDGLLTPLRSLAVPGWTSSMTQSYGRTSFVSSPADPNAARSAGDEIARMDMRVTLSSDTSTPVVLTSTSFNNGDSTYAHCVLGVGADDDSTEFHLVPFCGEGLYVSAMLGEPIGTVMVSQNATGITAEFTARVAEPVVLEVFDLLGNRVTQANAAASVGTNRVSLNIPQSGAYVLRATAGGQPRSTLFEIVR